MVWASASVKSGVYIKTLCNGRRDSRSIALTFDDGPDEETGKIMDILKKNNIKATFFLIGSKAASRPETVKRMIEDGHDIGIHSYFHKSTFPLQSAEKIGEELKKTENLLYDITGRRTSLFRPPFGVTNPPIAKAVKKSGYKTIGWDIRSFDTVASRSREKICKKIERKLKGGSIILLHDRLHDEDSLLSDILAIIKQKNLQVVPLGDLLNIEIYEN